MIVTIDPETGKMTYYRSLVQACKYTKELNYYTLRKKPLSSNRIIYKGMWVYRIKYY